MSSNGCEHQTFHVLYFCQLKAVIALGETSKNGSLAQAARNDDVWAVNLARVFGLVPTGTQRNLRDEFISWFQVAKALGLHKKIFESVSVPWSTPWLESWHILKNWLKKEAEELHITLRHPADQSQFDDLKKLFPGVKVDPLVAGFWSVHDGQKLPRQLWDFLRRPAEGPGMTEFQGLFGGYMVYDHKGTLMMLPIRAAIALTELLRGEVSGMSEKHPTKLAFAFGKFQVRRPWMKIMLVDVVDGGVHMWNPQCPLDNLLPVVPVASEKTAKADGLLRWFKEFVQRLHNGVYEYRGLINESPEMSIGICLFPAAGPELSRCVTRGVEVTASSAYMPEHPGHFPGGGWGYSIALRLLGTAEERGFETCQLVSRTWNIELDGEAPAPIVDAPGVIGYHPILTDGGWICNEESDPHGQYDVPPGIRPGEFRYQSRTEGGRNQAGKFSGWLKMVPGTMKKPEGPEFNAILNEIRISIPNFIY